MKYVGTYSDPKDIVTKDKLEAVASRVSTNEDNIAMAESDIEGLYTTVGALQTNVNNVQTALTGKQDTVVGGASTITEDNLTASRALISNSSGKVAVSAVTSTELGYLHNLNSNVQQQLSDQYSRTAEKAYCIFTTGTLSDNNITMSEEAMAVLIDALRKWEPWGDYYEGYVQNDYTEPVLVCSDVGNVTVYLKVASFNSMAEDVRAVFSGIYSNSGNYYQGFVIVNDSTVEYSGRIGIIQSVNGETGNVVLTPDNIGAVPTTRTINNKSLSSNITLTASDVDAIAAKDGTGTGTTKLEHLTVKEVEIDSNTVEGGALYGNSIINLKSIVAEAGIPSFTLHASGPNNTDNKMNMYSDHTTIELSDDSATCGLIIHAPETQSGLDEDGVIIDGLARFTPEAAATTYRSAPLTGMFYTDVIEPRSLPVVNITNNLDMLMVVDGNWQTDHGDVGIQNASSLIVNKWPDNVTMIVKSFRRWGKLCLFTAQLNVDTQISTRYGFTLLEMPYTSIDRVWINNQTQFYMDANGVGVRVNNNNLATGNYILTGFYLTKDNARVVS